MATVKHRINLSVPDDMDAAIAILAKRDSVSVTTKTLELVREALDLQEDIALEALAESRLAEKDDIISHRDTWKEFIK